MTRILLIAFLILPIPSFLSAQEPSEVDEEELFGDDELITAIEEKEKDLSTVLLTSDAVEIGGEYRFEASSSWNFDGPAGPFGAELVSDPLSLDLGALVFLDARPAEEFRVYAEVDVSYPFDDQGGTRSFDEVFRVTELFSDFQFADAIFFRAGKQTINWGVGYFFSPADLLNVTEIDPEDPEAELEGPVALKIHAPVGAHNLYLYTVFEDADSIDEIALAPKAEFVIADAEIGLGAFYRAGDAPAAMTTLSTSLLDFDIFAEGMVSYDERLYPSATVGFIYRYSDDLERFNISVSSQYLYNGEGTDDELHHGAASASWFDMLGSDFTLSCFWIGNLSDGSGMVAPSLSWHGIEELELTLKAGYTYGEMGGEYTPAPFGDTMNLSVSASLGGGAF